MGFISDLTGIGSVADFGKAVVNIGGGIMDRFWPKKMTEAEKWDKTKDMMQFELTQTGIEVTDVNKAREMYMAEVRAQKQPWIARLLNATFRPFCGFMAIFYLTDQLWSQILAKYSSDFTWKLIQRDPVVDALVGIIIYFFFGYRQRSKERGVTGRG